MIVRTLCRYKNDSRAYSELGLQMPCVKISPIYIHCMYIYMQIVFNRRTAIVRFAFMHMVATNICVWINTTVKEIQHEFLHSSVSHHDEHDESATLTPSNYSHHDDYSSTTILPHHSHHGEIAL